MSATMNSLSFETFGLLSLVTPGRVVDIKLKWPRLRGMVEGSANRSVRFFDQDAAVGKVDLEYFILSLEIEAVVRARLGMGWSGRTKIFELPWVTASTEVVLVHYLLTHQPLARHGPPGPDRGLSIRAFPPPAPTSPAGKDERFRHKGPTNNYCRWFHVCEHESNTTARSNSRPSAFRERSPIKNSPTNKIAHRPRPQDFPEAAVMRAKVTALNC